MIAKKDEFKEVNKLKNSDNYFAATHNRVVVFDSKLKYIRKHYCRNSGEAFSFDNFSHYIVSFSYKEILLIDTNQPYEEFRIPIIETGYYSNSVRFCESKEDDTFYFLCNYELNNRDWHSGYYKLFKVHIRENRMEEIFRLKKFPFEDDFGCHILFCDMFYHKKTNHIYFKCKISGGYYLMHFDLNKYAANYIPELDVLNIDFLKPRKKFIDFKKLHDDIFYFSDLDIIYAIDSDFKLKWKHHLQSSFLDHINYSCTKRFIAFTQRKAIAIIDNMTNEKVYEIPILKFKKFFPDNTQEDPERYRVIVNKKRRDTDLCSFYSCYYDDVDKKILIGAGRYSFIFEERELEEFKCKNLEQDTKMHES